MEIVKPFLILAGQINTIPKEGPLFTKGSHTQSERIKHGMEDNSLWAETLKLLLRPKGDESVPGWGWGPI